jgi:hypothetical protein
MKPHRGTLILVLGIVSIFVCGIILGPVAWVMGNNDLKEMAAGTMDPSGRDITNAGKICGMIALFLNIAGICLYAILVGGMIGAGGVPHK